MNKPIKVLQIQPKYYIRTSDLHEEIINALASDEFDVTSAYLNGTPKEGDMRTACKKVKYFNIPKNKLKGLRLSATFQLWKYCKEQKFDVIITHRFKPLYIFLLLNKFLKKPARCISVLHANGEFDRPYRRVITRLFVNKNWTFVGVSQSVKEDLLQYNNAGFTNENVIYINNSLDIEKTTLGLLPKNQARNKLEIAPDAFVFGTIGRLVAVKGHIYLLEAFKQIQSNHPSAKLVIIGGGKLEQNLKSFIQKNNLDSSVILTGNIFDAYQYLPAFDVFLLSSLSEAFGLVVLEAMIASLPVIATDVGGVKSVISDKGKLIPAANISALTIAMNEYIQLETQQLRSLGSDLHERAVNNFSITDYHKHYRNLVKNLATTT